jgi:hypothetical protein
LVCGFASLSGSLRMRLVVEFERSDADNGVKQKGSVEDVVASCLLLVHSFFLVDALVDTVPFLPYSSLCRQKKCAFRRVSVKTLE